MQPNLLPDNNGQQRVDTPPSFAPPITLNTNSLWKRIKRNWGWIFLCLVVAGLVAAFLIRYTPQTYRASTRIIVGESSAQSGLTKDAIIQELGFEKSYDLGEEILMMKSVKLMREVVDTLSLSITYVYQGQIRNTDIYRPKQFVLVPVDTVDAIEVDELNYGKVFIRLDDNDAFTLVKSPGDTVQQYYFEPFSIGDREYRLSLLKELASEDQGFIEVVTSKPYTAALRYSKPISILQVGKSNVIQITTTDVNRQRAMDILDALVNAYNDKLVNQQSRIGKKTLEFIEDRLSVVSSELYGFESQVATYRQDQDLDVNLETRSVDYLSQINENDRQLSELQIRKELIENLRANLATSDANSISPIPIASEITAGVLDGLIGEYNELAAIYSERTKRLKPDHPDIQGYIRQAADLRETIIRSIAVVLRENDRRIAQIEKRNTPLEEKLNRIPQNEKRLVQIMRQRQIKENLFLYLMEKREEAALIIAGQVPNTRIIDRAISSRSPIAPIPWLIILTALFAGTFVPVSLMLISEILNSKVTSESETLSLIKAPIVGRIIEVKQVKKRLISQANIRSAIAEGFRLLRTNLGFITTGTPSKVIVVTSSISGEGKTFVSGNLGISIALANKKVVLVESDMHMPNLTTTVAVSGTPITEPGLSNYLVNQCNIEDIIKPSGHDNLWIVPAGTKPPNPGDLLTSEKTEALIKHLRNKFDFVILDAPPAGVVSDSMVLSHLADITLYVVRLRKAEQKHLNMAQGFNATGKLKGMHVVLNGLREKENYGYGQGYY